MVDGIVKDEWREFVVVTDAKGRDRINRHVYECCVQIALRERVRCKEIWVEGADRWRNPDEDLPVGLRRPEGRELRSPRPSPGRGRVHRRDQTTDAGRVGGVEHRRASSTGWPSASGSWVGRSNSVPWNRWRNRRTCAV